MKPFLITFIGVFATSLSSFAQTTFWPKFGLNISQTTYELGYSYDQASNKVNIYTPSGYGFYAGLAVDIQLSKHFSIRPEVVYNQINVSWNKEVTSNYNSMVTYSSDVRNESRRYLTLPVSFVGKYKFGPGLFQLTLGPYISLGLSGGPYDQTLTQSDGYTANFKDKLIAGKVPLPWAVNPSYYNPLDVGANFGIGYQLNRILISGQFGLGFTNTQPHYEAYSESYRGDLVTKNRNISMGVSYRISKAKK